MKKSFFIFGLLVSFAFTSFGQGGWISLANFFEGRIDPISFSNGNKIYVGLGLATVGNQQEPRNDLWSYNTTSDVWTQRADFPSTSRFSSSAVEFNNKGYLMCGRAGSFPNFMTQFNDFWEYNPSLNTWTEKISLNGIVNGSANGTAFATSDAIFYISSQNKLWKYDQILDYWIPQADYPSLQGCSSFVINDKPYVCSLSGLLYQFDATSNTWIQKSSFPSTPRSFAIGFSIAGLGYTGLGEASGNYFSDIYRYEPNTDTWIQETNFPGLARGRCIASVSNNKAYIGLGWNGGVMFSDYWEFTPAITNKIVESSLHIKCKIFPNPTNDKFSLEESANLKQFESLLVVSQIGEEVSRFTLIGSKWEFDISNLPKGVFFIFLENSKSKVYIDKIEH